MKRHIIPRTTLYYIIPSAYSAVRALFSLVAHARATRSFITPLVSISRRDYLDPLSAYKTPPSLSARSLIRADSSAKFRPRPTPLAGKFGFNTICVPRNFLILDIKYLCKPRFKVPFKVKFALEIKSDGQVIVIYSHACRV